MTRRFCNFAFLVSLLLGHGLMAKVIYVDDNASAGGDGTSWASAHKYLQDALADAEYGDEIWVAEGTYKPDQGAGKTVGDRASPFVLENGVGMYGGFLGTENTRDPQGDNNQTILSGEISDDSELWSLNVVSGANLDANTTLDGFRITKGNANGTDDTVYDSGGGLYLKDSSLTLNNCVFTNNSANKGGGIYSNPTPFYSPWPNNTASISSFLTLTNCVFTNNSANKGGGIYYYSSSLTLTDCVFTNNSGGGIYSPRPRYSSNTSFLTLTKCVFTNNSGGGIYSYSSPSYSSLTSSLTLTDCVFTNNSGHGISTSNNSEVSSSSSYSLTLTNCVFTNNSGHGISTSNNSEVSSSSSSLTLTDCVFTNNSGDGISITNITPGQNSSTRSTLTLNKCVFTNNSSRGIYIYNDSPPPNYSYSSTSLTLTNCAFANNSDGGIYAFSRAKYSNHSSSSSLNITNCVFTNNSNRGIYTQSSGESARSSLILTNCVLANNFDGGIYSYSSPSLTSSLTLINSIFWENSHSGAAGHGLSGQVYDSFKSIVLQDAIEAQYPGDPNARDVVYKQNLNIMQGWDGDARAFNADPKFVNIDNPVGPDGIWFTEDDGLRVISGSPAINAGYNDSLPPDTSDIDGNKNITEPIPYDVLRRNRVVGSSVDIGPYEFDPDNPPPLVKNLLTLSTTTGGTVTGGGYYEQGTSTTIEAVPSSGYLFSNWSGDLNGSSNPLTITVDSAKSITANFAQDLNDMDGDGLTNFAELVTHLTKVDDNDTDNDGLLDNEEIQIGTDPNISNSNIVNFLNSKATIDQNNARSAGQTTGIDMVKANPSAYNLVAKSAYDQALLDANQSAEQAITDAKVSAKADGRSEGEQSVLGNPSAYNLFTSKQYEEALQSLDTNATPYTPSWFYNPKRGWMWTQKSAYPYFYDADSSNWMYFQSGHENPRFYHYGTKEWMTLE